MLRSDKKDMSRIYWRESHIASNITMHDLMTTMVNPLWKSGSLLKNSAELHWGSVISQNKYERIMYQVVQKLERRRKRHHDMWHLLVLSDLSIRSAACPFTTNAASWMSSVSHLVTGMNPIRTSSKSTVLKQIPIESGSQPAWRRESIKAFLISVSGNRTIQRLPPRKRDTQW